MKLFQKQKDFGLTKLSTKERKEVKRLLKMFLGKPKLEVIKFIEDQLKSTVVHPKLANVSANLSQFSPFGGK